MGVSILAGNEAIKKSYKEKYDATLFQSRNHILTDGFYQPVLDVIVRMLEAQTNEDAAKILVECGYSEMTEITNNELDRVLAEQQQAMMADLGGCAPNKYIVDVFLAM